MCDPVPVWGFYQPKALSLEDSHSLEGTTGEEPDVTVGRDAILLSQLEGLRGAWTPSQGRGRGHGSVPGEPCSLRPASGLFPLLGGTNLPLSRNVCRGAPGSPLFLFSILMEKL